MKKKRRSQRKYTIHNTEKKNSVKLPSYRLFALRSEPTFLFFWFCFTVFIFQIWRHHFIYLFFVVLEDDAYLLWSRCNLRFFWLFFFEKNFIIISYPICVCVSPGFLHFFLSLCSKNLYVWGMGKKRFKNKPFPSKKKEKRTEFRPMAELDGWSVGSPVDSIFYSLPVLWKRRRTCFVRFIYIFFVWFKGGGGGCWWWTLLVFSVLDAVDEDKSAD